MKKFILIFILLSSNLLFAMNQPKGDMMQSLDYNPKKDPLKSKTSMLGEAIRNMDSSDDSEINILSDDESSEDERRSKKKKGHARQNSAPRGTLNYGDTDKQGNAQRDKRKITLGGDETDKAELKSDQVDCPKFTVEELMDIFYTRNPKIPLNQKHLAIIDKKLKTLEKEDPEKYANLMWCAHKLASDPVAKLNEVYNTTHDELMELVPNWVHESFDKASEKYRRSLIRKKAQTCATEPLCYAAAVILALGYISSTLVVYLT